ncbi:MAG: NUDIX domain-containing protein, partial [Verrucomicrobiae bacterium]|nr:NUDIX domain-containing protein [Verrucomicrobiae bacterium]
MATYRPNVAAIFQRPNGKILVAERVDFRGSWQFPQGGVDRGEDLIAALHREVEEEIGLAPASYRVVACRTGYRYKFPGGHLKRGLYCGQVQTYFLCAYDGDGTDIDLTRHQREFSGTKWIRPEKFRLKWVPKFKRRVF